MPFLKRMLNVYDADQGVDAAGLVSGTGVLPAVAETEDLAAQAVPFLQYPQTVGYQPVGRDLVQAVQFVRRRDVRYEFLII